jgi:hypothetical protein
VTEQPPAGMLGRLRPIPTYRDHPATAPADIEGVRPDDPLGPHTTIDILGAAAPVLLLFLSAACLGCRDLWEGLPALRRELPAGLPVVVVTRGPGEEDAAAIAALAPAGTEVVMSSPAYAHYRVAGPPFLVVVDAREVRTEGVAWGIAETAGTVRAALDR